ncbi:MAG: FAD:protein FMN transferase [Coriobacteriales bacterium]|jgi:thiamine biosynthesis lipoprotein|nr:FAD:protein FMN transferase [Coriobacteriales bacterium]
MALTTVRGFYFDTMNVISCVADEAVLDEALGLCAFFESLLSRFVEGSDVWRINHARGASVEVNPHTTAILALAEEIRDASDGAFNIAVGEASALWDFSSATPKIPAADALKQAACRLLTARPVIEGSRVSMHGGVQIDLGGIAKGYICDQVADFLRAQGVTSGLLNFGGNVVTIGNHPEGRPWSVALQQPGRQREAASFAVVNCTNSAVVTSGPYERGFDLDKKRYHHILDPRSCWPVESELLSVSVLSANAALADALATAILVLGANEGLRLAQRYNAELILLDDTHKVHYSKNAPLTLIAPLTPQTITVPLV